MKPKIGIGCEIKQTQEGIYINGVKQEGVTVTDVQIKKNSHRWTEVQITYMANSFIKEKFYSSSYRHVER